MTFLDLHGARAHVGGVLEALDGVRVYSEGVPERVEPPCVVLTEDTPWVERGATYGEWDVRWSVLVLTPQVADNAAQVAALDQVVDDVLGALAAAGHRTVVTEVTALTHAGAAYLGARITHTHTLLTER